MKKHFFLFSLAYSLTACNDNATSTDLIDPQFVKEATQYSSQQYKHLIAQVPDEKFPRTFEKDTVRFSGSGWWCSGFYSGNLFQLFTLTGDSSFYHAAVHNLQFLGKEQYNTGTHDLGFMMFDSFGKWYDLYPADSVAQILVNSAWSLSSRYNDTVKAIRSWNSRPEDFLVIIDNMMNLELLIWASEYTGNSRFREIAIQHANTTLKNHFREDGSSYHVLNYDPQTGAIKEKKTAQGYSDESAWSRGQAWGLYGFTYIFRATGDSAYLQQANKIAAFITQHPNLPDDKVPYWDFNAPDIPDAPRDASAAAIISAALYDLAPLQSTSAQQQSYRKLADSILQNLYNHYRYNIGEGGGFLLSQSVGHLSAGSEISVPLTYADYYFLESLLKRAMEN